MRVLALARKDLMRVWRDRRAFVINLLLPLLLTTVMGLSFGGGMFGNGGISAIPVVVVGDDLPAAVREQLATALNETGFFTVSWAERDEASRRVTEGEAAAAVVLPPDAMRAYLSGDEFEIELWKDPVRTLKSGIVEQILTRALREFQAGEAAYRGLWPEDEKNMPPAAGDLTWDELFDGDFNTVWKRWRDLESESGFSAVGSWALERMDHQVALTDVMADRHLALNVDDAAAMPADEETGELNHYDFFLPSIAVFFLMFGVAASARDLHRERAAGTLQRQLVSPVSGLELLAGKWLAAVAQGTGQVLILLLAGAVLFKVNLGPDPWSLLTMVVLSAAAASGLFMLLAVVTPTEKVMDNVSTSVVLVSAMIGGNMMPVDALPAWIIAVGRWVFNYWANIGFRNVVALDRSLAQDPEPVWRLLGMILVFAVLTVVVHTVRKRRGGLL